MPPSQLKRLKASLREQGITGPQKSKKQKKNRQGDNADQRAQKAAALEGIRESFNPFEFKGTARPKKFEYTTNRPTNGKVSIGRPGVTKSMGEETRRKTLLPELHKRNKVGGILDRRIGENDPTMTPDERMMARFTREQERKKKGASVFDLEEAEDEVELTHGGRSLRFDAGNDQEEDYDAGSVEGFSDDEDIGVLHHKRRRESDEQGENSAENAEEQPERKKSKSEVMKEVIAKSKLHKYERQQVKEDDEDLREELDKDLPDILAALRGDINRQPLPPPVTEPKESPINDHTINPDRAALLAGKSREALNKDYDTKVRQMMYDQRSKPTERTKTEEEKAQEEAERLKQLEKKRMQRMRGEAEAESESEDERKLQDDESEEEESDRDDAAEFGLSTAPSRESKGTRPQGVEDEDDFVMDDDLIASDSEADVSDVSDEDSEAASMGPDEDDEFLKNILPGPSKSGADTIARTSDSDATVSSKLAFTYPCPRSHSELLDVLKGVSNQDVVVVIQRIRALYHKGLHQDNKAKLADFSTALVDHITHLSNQTPAASLTVIEQLIRHIHSLSRDFPIEIATRFRYHLKKLQASNDPTPGDLTILTAISTIYPTSDHFHQVVTPAITLMARWLGLSSPQTTKDVATGAMVGALCIKYQKLSKRYIPELVRYTLLALQSPHATPPLIDAHIKNLLSMADLWSTKSAFPEIFPPKTLTIIQNLNQKPALQRLQILLHQSRLSRRPLQLHHHRPLPIKTSLPKFEESFNPSKHYDPDKERSEAKRLQKEYKRERKGALRELRKDANFIARQQLKEKKERDKRYEEKFRRLVAEIQGEEGGERNKYEREKRARKRRG